MAQRDPRLIGGIYYLGSAITSGGMLTSYTASNRNTSEMVGLQVIALPHGIDPQFVQRLLLPVETRRSIVSPFLIRVYDQGIDGDRIYIATDPPRGVTLRHVLDTENIDIKRALDLARQIGQGLQALHDHGLVGIDLRPELITVETEGINDRLQLDDVGLRLLLKQLGYTDSQRVDDIGYLDPRYAPPEYIQNGRIGPWSDIYQTGLLLFEQVTGRLPFVGRNPAETGILQTSSPIPRLAQFKHDTPDALQSLIDCALAKNPTERYQNIAQFLDALSQVVPILRPTSPERSDLAFDHEGKNSGTSFRLTGEMPPYVGNQPSLSLHSSVAAETIPVEEGVYAYLCYEKEGEATQRFAIKEKSVVIGRVDPKRGLKPDIDLTALDPTMTVSRQHIRIRSEEGFFYIEDLKSHNRTRLGALKLTEFSPEIIQHGDVVRLGAVRLVFRVPGMQDKPVLKDESAQ